MNKNLILASSIASLVLATAVPAQNLRPARMSRQLMLARICAGEAGLQTSSPDCAGIYHVLRRRAAMTGRTWRQQARAYSGGDIQPRGGSRVWLGDLRPSGARPEGWHHHLGWNLYRERWLELYRHAGAVIAGRVQDPCSTAAVHWGIGGPASHPRNRRHPEYTTALARGWNEVNCGSSRNAFWTVGRRRTRRTDRSRSRSGYVVRYAPQSTR